MKAIVKASQTAWTPGLRISRDRTSRGWRWFTRSSWSWSGRWRGRRIRKGLRARGRGYRSGSISWENQRRWHHTSIQSPTTQNPMLSWAPLSPWKAAWERLRLQAITRAWLSKWKSLELKPSLPDGKSRSSWRMRLQNSQQASMITEMKLNSFLTKKATKSRQICSI